jgi:hypothetical protein
MNVRMLQVRNRQLTTIGTGTTILSFTSCNLQFTTICFAKVIKQNWRYTGSSKVY